MVPKPGRVSKHCHMFDIWKIWELGNWGEGEQFIKKGDSLHVKQNKISFIPSSFPIFPLLSTFIFPGRDFNLLPGSWRKSLRDPYGLLQWFSIFYLEIGKQTIWKTSSQAIAFCNDVPCYSETSFTDPCLGVKGLEQCLCSKMTYRCLSMGGFIEFWHVMWERMNWTFLFGLFSSQGHLLPCLSLVRLQLIFIIQAILSLSKMEKKQVTSESAITDGAHSSIPEKKMSVQNAKLGLILFVAASGYQTME